MSMRENQLNSLSLKCSILKPPPRFYVASFFFRTHLQWNVLPTVFIPVEFETKLKHHMRDVVNPTTFAPANKDLESG